MPKLAMKDFKGRHFIGGRFIPSTVAKELNIEAPEYEGASLYRELS
jgi:NAD(P)H-hydrate epimerase